MACSCCRVENYWDARPISSGYEANTLKQLQLGAGEFTVDEEETWSISKIERTGEGFVFRSDVGAFTFKPSGQPEHRMVDVAFIQHPKDPEALLTDPAGVYHEVVLVGLLQLPGAAAKYLKRNSLAVTLVLRGVGTMCFEVDTLDRWLIRSNDPALPFLMTGGGVVIPAKPAQ